MQKVLIVTYYWPPAGGPGVQRWLYFASYMREFGIDPVIYTPENPHYPIRDEGLKAQVPSGIKIYRKSIWEPYHLAGFVSRKKTKRISSGIINREKPSVIERLLLWVRGNLFIPDARKFWVKPSVKYLEGILEKEKIDTVITTGPPHSLHLIGLGLKKIKGIKWIADFRDPWTSIGYHDVLYLSKRTRNKHELLERQVLRRADRVITTSEKTRNQFKEVTGRPIHVVTNGYSGARNQKGQPPGSFSLAHIGSLLSGRNPLALWRALKNLVNKHEDFKEDLVIELIGLVSEEVIQSLEDNGLNPFLSVTPYLPHRDALSIQRKAQVLLLLEIDSPQTASIIPGKMFEYLAAARPILAIGPVEWEAGQRVEECESGAYFGFADQERIEAQLLQWYRVYQNGQLEVNGKGVSRYHRRELTGRLVKEVLWA